MKIVINTCHGGYKLSQAAYKELGIEWNGYGFALSDDRANHQLVATVEKLGLAASGFHAALEVVEIPNDVKWMICDHDGMEHVAEQHRTWGHD